MITTQAASRAANTYACETNTLPPDPCEIARAATSGYHLLVLAVVVLLCHILRIFFGDLIATFSFHLTQNIVSGTSSAAVTFDKILPKNVFISGKLLSLYEPGDLVISLCKRQCRKLLWIRILEDSLFRNHSELCN